MSYLVDGDLSNGYCSSLFQQPGPSTFNNYYSSVQSRPRFCVIDGKYSILAQNEMIMESYWRKKKEKKKIEVASYINTPRVTGDNKGKFKKMCFLVWKERAKLLVFQTTCVQVLYVSGVPLFRIGLSYFTIMFQLYNNYLTVYCNKRIKTVKSTKTTKCQC